MLSLSLFGAMLISLGFLTYFNLKLTYEMMIVFKTVTSILFLGIAYAAKKEAKNKIKTLYFKWMFLGLFFSLIGDVCMVIVGNSKGILFILGVASFAFAHISYLIGFFQFEKVSRLNIIWSSAIFLFLFCLLNFSPCLDFQGLKPLLMVYALLISLMVGKSFSLWKYRKENSFFVYLTIGGAVFFLISDSVLLFHLFGPDSLWYLLAVNNVIYYIGQGLFGLSFKKEFSLIH